VTNNILQSIYSIPLLLVNYKLEGKCLWGILWCSLSLDSREATYH